MSPHRNESAQSMDSDGDTPPEHRHRSSERNVIVQPAPAERPKFWTGEAIIGAIGSGIVVGTSLLALAGHAYILQYQVTQLEKDRDAAKVAHVGFESRMRDIETTVAANRAEADKRESLVERGLGDINAKLDTLQTSVDQLQQHHH